MYPFPSMHKGLFMFLHIPCLPQIISAYFPLNLMPRNSVVDAAQYLAYLSWESESVKWARKNHVPTIGEKQPSPNRLGKMEEVNANKYYEVNVSGHSFLGMGLSEIGEWAGS